MATIIDFTAWVIENQFGCSVCQHLNQIGKNTYSCGRCSNEYGGSIYPIVDGKKTEDYNLCNGEYMVRVHRKKRKA